MPVSGQQASALRALLSGDTHEAALLTVAMPAEDTPAFGLLLQAALVRTARRYFAPAYESGDIIRYVARLRAGLASQTSGGDLDPRTAEAVLRRALGEPARGGVDGQAWLHTVPALLAVLANDLTLIGSALDEVIGDAEALARRWQAGAQGGVTGSRIG